MNKYLKIYSFLLLLSAVFCYSQTEKKSLEEIKKFRKELNAEYKNPSESPLRGEQLTQFLEHPFFPINLKYRVSGKLIRTENPVPFEIPTSSGKTKSYQEYGRVHFVLDGKKYELTVFQSLSLMKQKKYKDYLFLPFRDQTNGSETYGGGRYLDLKIPKDGVLILDFNKAYQPYCAYNAMDYSCPIVPQQNFLTVRIEAGVMYRDIYH